MRPRTGQPPTALTIAGSDPSGGAGIQADLKAFAALGAYGASVLTALTAQNTTGVRAVHVPPLEFLEAQLDAVLGDLPVRATKTGMLASAPVVAAVAARAAAGQLPNLVVDPVMVASAGGRLVDPAAEGGFADLLFPHALVVTPNVAEASRLVGSPMRSVDDLAEAARELHRRGPGYVVVKGGDLSGPEAVDAVFDGRHVELLRAGRVATGNDHGTGCTFSAAIAARLARGDDPISAIRAAKSYVSAAISGATAWRLGAGHGPLDHFPGAASAPWPRLDAPGRATRRGRQ